MKILDIARNTFLPHGVTAFKCSRMGAAAINGGFNTAIAAMNNIANWRATKNTNKTNLQISREANEAQHTLQMEQNDWNYNMWQEQNEYNSPTAQRQRLVDAGVNPLMMDGGFSAGAASAPAQGVDPMPQNVANVNPANFDFSSLEDFGRSIAEIHNIEARTEGQRLQNGFMPQTFSSEMEARNALTHYTTLMAKDLANAIPFNSKKRQKELDIMQIQRDTYDLNLKFLNDTFEDRKKQLSWLTKISERQWQDFEHKWRLIRQEIRKMSSDMLVNEAKRQNLISSTATLDALRPEQLNSLREEVIHQRLSNGIDVLQIPPMYRPSFLKILDSYGYDAVPSFQKALNKTSWYKEPDNILKYLMLGSGVIMSPNPFDSMVEQLDQIRPMYNDDDIMPYIDGFDVIAPDDDLRGAHGQ